eukprot:714953-Hanusia_phi.AAC.2
MRREEKVEGRPDEREYGNGMYAAEDSEEAWMVMVMVVVVVEVIMIMIMMMMMMRMRMMAMMNVNE